MGALEGKTAIVTGASSGIGAATARFLAAAGARVAVGARRTDRLAPLGDGCIPLALDVVDPESCGRFVAAAVAELRGVDILVNAAGLALGRDPFTDSTEEDEEAVLETNVHGLLRMTRLCLPHIRDGGHTLRVKARRPRAPCSEPAPPNPDGAVYVTSKFAVRGFTYALREDLLGRRYASKPDGRGRHPVDCGTEFSLVRLRGDAEAARRVYEGVEAMTPEGVAECVLFAVTRPPHVNVDEIVVEALAQTSGGRILGAG